MRITYILFLFTIISFAQSKNEFEIYNEFEQKAMLQFKDKEYEKALLNFQNAINLKPSENVTIYFYAVAAALNIGKLEKAKELIIASIHKTNASKSYFLNFEEFNNFRDQSMFAEIEKDYEKHISIFYKELEHPKIYREIDSLIKIDQKVRKNDSDRYKIMQIDSSNVKRLIEITKQYGWQSKGWLILWHQRGTYGQDNYVWNFFKPYINEQIQKGKIKKSFWTMFEEEQSIIKNKEQIYGLYFNYFDQYPIKDIEYVDKRRTENGLTPLWYMEKVYGVKLPTNYIKL
ncbi:hypothetical protein AX016_3325 [Cellulophaga sp. RHA19]|uniref:hypothetical protein n=1 Tax=Cellulophaga sp. RHA19 TaxID=1798237 RepID=UPI000C2BD5F0|nr:hypothetical protein [Cellulophaga sp. RHA19]PKB45087.1 hypothetical protein AX016_3325 [Cellulophaga sp. RHA19]